MLGKSSVRLVAALAILVFASSGAAFAHFASDQKAVESGRTTQPKVESATTNSNPVPNSTLTPIQSEPCTKTVTETNDTSGPNATNIKKTEVHCQSHSSSGSTSVDVENSTDQSAVTGDSTGQSGTASNTDTTDINVN